MADKEKLAELFLEIGEWLELKGDNPFKIRAYEAAARVFEQLEEDPAVLAHSGKLEDLPGVGKAIAAKAQEFFETGRIAYHDELRSSIPAVLFELVKIPGLGAKKARLIYEKLGVQSVGELEYACKENRLLELPGFGAKTQAKILAGIESLRRFQGRTLISEALPAAEEIAAYLAKVPGVTAVAVAGSIRRRRETVGDVDIVAGGDEHAPVMQAVMDMPSVLSVIAQGPTKTSVTLRNGLNVDVRLVTPAQYPSALHHFTGSKEHNVALRGLARELGLKISEYGVERPDGSVVLVEDEAALYRLLGLDYIEPELREGGDEIAAAREHRLPRLVREGEIRGAFHLHTTRSDGRATVEQLVAAAKKRGWSYLGISDHSRTAFYAGGLKPEAVREQLREIAEYNAAHPEFRIFAGIESDILPDGSLDYDEELLAEFDFVIGSVHSSFNMAEAAMTERITNAMRNPFLTMLGHPTGRLLLARDAYAVDLNEIIRVAAATGTILEINASPYRLDLDWRWCRQAQTAGVMLAINPDAHSTEELAVVSYGVGIARKGWLEAEDILNTRPAAEVTALLSRKRKSRP
jgi:DNA polymerase (family 10)